jgi:hypothetical protein
MSTKDVIHEMVKEAIIKDGWKITHDPYTIAYKDEHVYADLAAERVIAAERQGDKIVVEIKSFVGPSTIQDFKGALGQYRLYLFLLAETAPEYKLYLAISDVVYKTDFQREMIQLVIKQDKIPLIVVDINTKEIVKWIE